MVGLDWAGLESLDDLFNCMDMKHRRLGRKQVGLWGLYFLRATALNHVLCLPGLDP